MLCQIWQTGGGLPETQGEHPDFVRAKHDRRQFISSRQRFTAVMLRPYEYIGKIEMHPTQAGLYGQFVDWVYRWKADEEILDQREAIDTALARLALAAIEQNVSRILLSVASDC